MRKMKGFWLPLLLLAFPLIEARAGAQWNPPNPVVSFEKQTNGVEIHQQAGTLRLEVDAPDLLHVTYLPLEKTESHPSDNVVVKKDWPAATFDLASDEKTITLSTAKLKIVVERESGALRYEDAAGQQLTTEAYRSLRPVEVNGEKTHHAESFFAIYGSHEGLYGLGQHQAGVWNYRGETVDLSQENTEIAVPLLVSTNGYGIFWNNPSRSRVNNRFVHSLYLSAEVADRIDYYFIYGPGVDQIIGRYRELTGEVPLFGRWAYGFWQCKNKYQSQAEIEGVAAKYRSLHIPVDNIVQDWFWWVTMGEMKWNSKYPDPQGMINKLHEQHFHLMVSVWPYFRPGTSIYDQFDKNGWFIAKTLVGGFHPLGQALYDPSNPQARAEYWKNIDASLFAKGVDAWWLDTDEPETEGREDNILIDHKVHIGSGARYANIYPLWHSEGVSQGQQTASDKKRVFILSRSAYAGSQRLGVTAWSGDVLSDWETFKRQIPAGLNYSISGNPYWTTDIGGFISGGNLNDPKFRELFIRWFQFGAFSPIFRVHGTRYPDENELWSYGPDAQKILVDYDNLRYRLLPYIYSQAWQITSNRATLMRPLVMDWRDDVDAQDTGDEYLFGPAILVSPVTTQGATSRRVYLPKAEWYDFWTGAKMDGARYINAEAPLDKLPLFVRAGSILPLGPAMEWSTQKPADPIEIRIYPGADGDFTLYEDENDNYNYTKGQHATIRLQWDDTAKTLTIGARQGSFPGMIAKHTFNVIVVAQSHGAGALESTQARRVEYSGDQVQIHP
ncbi:glycoside hydrolase family 31 protein [Occallatibacter savannae]|uniref:glycoside hydrolase family 31 protein n=1 Tax=Occallatibacter savannae TaxID=1002691 RepID=UPI000D6951BA|nr:glycoside hydrolase family 31 protein [Occallatibacter savannae]